MSGLWRKLTGGTPGRWSFWRFNWLANHKVIAAVERTRHHAHGVMLDVGCGSMRARRWYEGRITRYLGIDLAASPYLEDARLSAIARGEALPFRAGSVDTVLGISMLTCLAEPIRLIEESYRVLTPGGSLILEFTQMAPLHDEPHDYFRFTRFGARWLLERAGFEVVECVPIGGLWARVGLSAIAALNRVNRGPWRVFTELPVRALYVLIQLGCELFDRAFFDPREVLAHLVVARKPPRPGA
jgi:SAM-dependent methyltransferase